jgi:hypothetical protein
MRKYAPPRLTRRIYAVVYAQGQVDETGLARASAS